MDGAKYRSILEENLLEATKLFNLRLVQRFTFQQDNDPKHTATLEWFRSRNINVLEWAIENWWQVLNGCLQSSLTTCYFVLVNYIKSQ